MIRTTYQSVRDLLAADTESVSIENAVSGRSAIAVLAPQAGSIEPMTGELARAIAGKIHRFYGFNGMSVRDTFRYRIPAVRFDEPILQSVLQGARTAIAINGASGDEDAVTLIGGVNRRLVEAIRARLEAAGFAVMDAQPRDTPADPRSLFNRVPEGGVQLELTNRLREDLRGGWLRRLRFEAYVAAIRSALAQELAIPGPAWEDLRTRSASAAI